MTATAKFDRSAPVNDIPFDGAAAVTPADGTDLSRAPADGLWIGGAGTLKVDMANGDVGITFSGIVAGTLLPFGVTRVYATGTTATLIVALYT